MARTQVSFTAAILKNGGKFLFSLHPYEGVFFFFSFKEKEVGMKECSQLLHRNNTGKRTAERLPVVSLSSLLFPGESTFC